MSTHPQSILITGASSGIGAALALHYAAPGIRLALSGRNTRRLEETANAGRAKGATVTTKTVDVTGRAAMAEWIEAEDDSRPLDLIIANAGISGGTGGGGENSEQVRKIFDTNVTGVFNTIDPILPRMQARKNGQIAIMASLAGFSGWPGAPVYSAAKAAVRVYGEALRGSLKGSGVRVNVICPGYIRTPMTAVNDFPMPFMIDADKAAKIIATGLAKNRGRIAFPLSTYFLAGFFGLLPLALNHAVTTRLPRKPSCDT